MNLHIVFSISPINVSIFFLILMLLQERFLNFKAHKVLKELFKQCVVENEWVNTEQPWCDPNKNLLGEGTCIANLKS